MAFSLSIIFNYLIIASLDVCPIFLATRMCPVKPTEPSTAGCNRLSKQAMFLLSHVCSAAPLEHRNYVISDEDARGVVMGRSGTI